MGKNLIFDAILVRGLTRFANQVQRGVEGAVHGYLRGKTRSKGAGKTRLLPNVYQAQGIFHGAQVDLDPLFHLFASTKLTEWQRTSSSAVGSVVRFQYQASDMFGVELTPLTAAARAQEAMEYRRDPLRYDNCIEKLRYKYVCDFEFKSQGSTVIVRYSTVETIATRGGTQRDLVTQYGAPSLPEQFGDIGELFLEGLRARGLM